MSNTIINRAIVYQDFGWIKEKDSNVSVEVVECSRCHSIVNSASKKEHTKWHIINNDG